MILRHLTSVSLRATLVAAAALLCALALSSDADRAPTAFADPAYGSVRLSPHSGAVIEGHIFSVPVNLTSCPEPVNVSGFMQSATTTTITDVTKNWTANQWANYSVMITQGPGSFQLRRIISNTNNTLTVGFQFFPTPGANAQYQIIANSGAATGGTSNTLVDTTKSWTANQWVGYDIVLNFGTGSIQQLPVLSNTSNTVTVDGVWGPIAQSGTTTSATNTTLTDAGSSWVTVPQQEFQNMTVELLDPPPGSLLGNQARVITSHTADTLTVGGGGWPDSVGNTNETPSGGTSTTLVDTGETWTPNAFVGWAVEVTGGPNAGKSRVITANTGNTLTVSPAWPISTGGVASSATSTTITDVTKTWTPNEFAGMTIELTSGAGAGQSRTVLSNTATTITVSSAFSPAPDDSTIFQVLRTPDNTWQYKIRQGPAENTSFQIHFISNPAANTSYEFVKTQCHLVAYDMTINYNTSKFTLVTGSGLGTGGTATTLTDNTESWKINQWAGTSVRITSGAGFNQIRKVVSNTATTLTVTPAWSTSPSAPGVGSGFELGGFTDGGWVGSTGRQLSCPSPATYGSGTASLACVTLGAQPQGPTGNGTIVNLVLQAGSHQGNLNQTFPLTNVDLVQIDGSAIPADVFTGTRRVILCPDSAPVSPGPDGIVNVGDAAVMANAVFNGASIGEPLYSPAKDPNEDGVVNPGDQALLANVFGKRCVQQ